jgi:Fe2+ or Zn2+ uptake regulation protein
MLSRDGYGRHRPIIVCCDECGETYQTATSDLETALDRARRMGWRVEKKKRVWTHVCDECVDKEGSSGG